MFVRRVGCEMDIGFREMDFGFREMDIGFRETDSGFRVGNRRRLKTWPISLVILVLCKMITTPQKRFCAPLDGPASVPKNHCKPIRSVFCNPSLFGARR